MVDRRRLMDAAQRVRRALEETRRELPDVCLQDFPRGACGDASLVLARFLVETGVHAREDIRYVVGRRGVVADGTWGSHAWLVVDGQIVDITADQFGEGAPEVWLPSSSAWHEQFEIDSMQSRTPDASWDTRDPIEAALARSYAIVAERARLL